ncbi:MAG: hypothetical protein HC939_13600 [Pleurocapsa sp. SU_5_0]|nr:hypothetical protein [Pleurocapsa sp. SU_5_0]NJR44810.1 hypothetical protein [Hyellaceae cyanobacterium CSU_1_1]
MNVNSSCPCCSSSMLLHLSGRRSFWLCSHCRTEIPNSDNQRSFNKSTPINLSSSSRAAFGSLQLGQVAASI